MSEGRVRKPYQVSGPVLAATHTPAGHFQQYTSRDYAISDPECERVPKRARLITRRHTTGSIRRRFSR